jgi:hypothetical protein
MRSIALLVAISALAGPATAETWKEYSYSDYAFSVTFPADPKMDSTNYQPVDGRSVPAHVWSITQNKSQFKVTVADIANTGLDENAVIDHAMKVLSQGGEVKVNFPHRISRVYGRQFSIAGADGSHETAAVFDYNGRVYQIEAKVLAGGDDTDIIRFQQSLIFTDGGSNRPQDTISAIRQACRGVVNNPAGLDDPRCTRK